MLSGGNVCSLFCFLPFLLSREGFPTELVLHLENFPVAPNDRGCPRKLEGHVRGATGRKRTEIASTSSVVLNCHR